MWRSSAAALLLAIGGSAQAATCLPPIFEGGQRLHAGEKVSVNWLDPLFRQHEVCWRRPRSPDELRIFVVGNSGPFGFPLDVREAFTGVLNRSLGTKSPPAYVYNLGFVYSYQLKEALVLQEARHYEPDWIVYGISLSDFYHLAPVLYRDMGLFFRSNSQALQELVERRPPGLLEPAQVYVDRQRARVRPRAVLIALREAGLLARHAARAHARFLRGRLFPDVGPLPDPPPAIPQVAPSYSCEAVHTAFYEKFTDWPDWHPFGHLDQIRRETGARILIVNWPAAREQRGTCYNRRYPGRSVAIYNAWLRQQVADAGFHYLDLHDLLASDEFFDTVHARPKGHRKISRAVEAELESLIPEW